MEISESVLHCGKWGSCWFRSILCLGPRMHSLTYVIAAHVLMGSTMAYPQLMSESWDQRGLVILPGSQG